MISDSEMEDFKAAIVAAGFEVDDFNAEPLEDDTRDAYIVVRRRDVGRCQPETGNDN